MFYSLVRHPFELHESHLRFFLSHIQSRGQKSQKNIFGQKNLVAFSEPHCSDPFPYQKTKICWSIPDVGGPLGVSFTIFSDKFCKNHAPLFLWKPLPPRSSKFWGVSYFICRMIRKKHYDIQNFLQYCTRGFLGAPSTPWCQKSKIHWSIPDVGGPLGVIFVEFLLMDCAWKKPLCFHEKHLPPRSHNLGGSIFM